MTQRGLAHRCGFLRQFRLLWITFGAGGPSWLSFAAMQGPDSTDGGSGATIEADVAALRRLAGRLHGLAAEMSEHNGSLLADLDPQLQDVLQRAERDWWDQRRRLHSYLSASARAVDGAWTAYHEVDSSVARAVPPSRWGGGTDAGGAP
jgi:hypothetical protein